MECLEVKACCDLRKPMDSHIPPRSGQVQKIELKSKRRESGKGGEIGIRGYGEGRAADNNVESCGAVVARARVPHSGLFGPFKLISDRTVDGFRSKQIPYQTSTLRIPEYDQTWERSQRIFASRGAAFAYLC
jgi:hypothetical protein